MREFKFEVGSVVRLKSGGPMMTISKRWETVASYKYYHCLWFGENGCNYSADFVEETLVSS